MANQRTRRNRRAYKNIQRSRQPEFINPYPWMGDAEAMVHLELERRNIPFAWRWFDGEAPTLQELLPGYAPEFTLREERLVITVTGEYFGTLPGVIEREALAQVALEEDGWKFVSLLGERIKQEGANVVLNRKAPELRTPEAQGKPRESPYDRPTYMQGLRERASAQALRRSKFALDEEQRTQEEDPDDPRRTRRTRPRRERNRPRNTRRRHYRESSE